MCANEDEGFQELYDRLLAYSSTKHKKNDPMDVDALNKSAGKGKSNGKGKKSKGKGKGKPSNAANSNWQKGWTEKGDEHSVGWTWKGDEQADGWWKTTGGRQQMTGHHGNQKNQWAQLMRSTAWKDARATRARTQEE